MAIGVVELTGDHLVYENLGDVSAATRITASNLQDSLGLQASYALVSVEGNAVRFRIDGTNPTNTNGDGRDNGTYLMANDTITIHGYTALDNFRVIEAVSGSTAYVHVQIFK